MTTPNVLTPGKVLFLITGLAGSLLISLSAQLPRPNTIAYAASTFAMAGLNHSLAIDGRAHGIASSIFHPGAVGTELVRGGARDPTTLIGSGVAAAAVLAMADLPDHVNFVETTMLPASRRCALLCCVTAAFHGAAPHG